MVITIESTTQLVTLNGYQRGFGKAKQRQGFRFFVLLRG